jgi:nucleotide-binding universal stress UspA family protein
MALNDLLVHVTNSKNARARIEASVALAMRHEANLTGIGVRMTSKTPVYALAAIPADILRDIEAQENESMAAAKTLFESVVGQAGWLERSSWIDEAGDTADVISRNARLSDITIVGQQADGAHNDLPDDFVLQSGRPGLVIPKFGAPHPIGERIVVAWNGGREAARAIADAMPILEKSKSVIILSVEPRDMGELPGSGLAQHLARHGVDATAKQSVADNSDASDVLLNFVADESADLIVMGAYGHSRLREVILGGMTRDLLTHMTIPVFMSH